MDCKSFDKRYSECVVSCMKFGTKFYLTETGVGSDIRSRAKIYPDSSAANYAAILANSEKAWEGFHWESEPA